MPEEVKKEEEVIKGEKIVDIDTSGPAIDITLPEDKDPKEVTIKDPGSVLHNI